MPELYHRCQSLKLMRTHSNINTVADLKGFGNFDWNFKIYVLSCQISNALSRRAVTSRLSNRTVTSRYCILIQLCEKESWWERGKRDFKRLMTFFAFCSRLLAKLRLYVTLQQNRNPLLNALDLLLSGLDCNYSNMTEPQP